MLKPKRCVTPKRDRETYNLNARDIRNLKKLVDEARAILDYYINMPENLTGELQSTRDDDLEALQEAIAELHCTIDDVRFV